MDKRCPRKLKNYPDSPCSEGKKAMESTRKGENQGCPWFVAEASSCYCFFKLMADDGRAIPAHRIAHLLMIDDSEVKRVIQSFRRKVPNLFKVTDTNEII